MSKKRPAPNRWLILVLLALLAIVAWGITLAGPRGVPVRTAAARRGEIREFVDERGTTRLAKTHLITMPFNGQAEEIELVEGERVAAGQVVARVSREDLEAEVEQARAAVAQIEASIAENDDATVETLARRQAELFVESMESTVEAAESRKTAGQRALEVAESSLGRVRRLQETGAETQEALERAELAYVQSQVDYRQDVLVAEALNAIKSATDLLPQMIRQQISRKSLSRAVLEQQKQEAEAKLRQALTRQERGEMRSPVDGVVLERAERNERFLSAGTVLLRIGQLEKLEVEAELLSEDVAGIETGNAVEIYGPAIGTTVGQGVAGTVHRIHPAAFTKVSSLGVEQQRVTVIIRFADGVLSQLRQSQQLGVGYRVRVRILTRSRSDALIVPRSALFRGADGSWQLFVVRDGRALRQEIEVGLMNDTIAEVTSGLDETERIVLAPENSLEHGTRVRPGENEKSG